MNIFKNMFTALKQKQAQNKKGAVYSENKDFAGSSEDKKKEQSSGFTELSFEQKDLLFRLQPSLIAMQIFMHFKIANENCSDETDQEWRNQAIYFWFDEEIFPNKALPPHFKRLPAQRFLLTGTPGAGINIGSGAVIPWFNQPGGGTKFYFTENGTPVTLKRIQALKLITYVRPLSLKDYFEKLKAGSKEIVLLLDRAVCEVVNGNICINNKVLDFTEAIEFGAVKPFMYLK